MPLGVGSNIIERCSVSSLLSASYLLLRREVSASHSGHHAAPHLHKMASHPAGSRYRNKLFHNLPLGMVFYHNNNRNVTNAAADSISFLSALLSPCPEAAFASGAPGTDFTEATDILTTGVCMYSGMNTLLLHPYVVSMVTEAIILLFSTSWHCAQVPSTPPAHHCQGSLLGHTGFPCHLDLCTVGHSVSIFSSHPAPSDYLGLWHHPSSRSWMELPGRLDRLFLCTPLPCSSR